MDKCVTEPNESNLICLRFLVEPTFESLVRLADSQLVERIEEFKDVLMKKVGYEKDYVKVGNLIVFNVVGF